MKPLSPSDQLFLYLEKRQQPMHVAGLQLFEFPEEAGDDYVSELAESLRQSNIVVPPFNQRLVRRLGQYYWTEDKLFDLEHHFRHEALPKPGRIRELLAHVSAEHSHLMDRQRPLWQFHLIEGLQDRRFALYIKAHHAMVDGVSAMRMTQDAFSTDSARRDLPPIWSQTSRRNGGQRSPLDVVGSVAHLVTAAGKQVATLPAVTRELARTVYRSLRDPQYEGLFEAPQSILNRPITGSRRFAAQSYALSRIKRIGKACNATVNDIVLAVCASALRHYLDSLDALPRKPLIAMVPMSVRQDDSAGGNQVGMILASLATDIADPEARLRAIQASIDEGKARFASMTPEEVINYTALSLAPRRPQPAHRPAAGLPDLQRGHLQCARPARAAVLEWRPPAGDVSGVHRHRPAGPEHDPDQLPGPDRVRADRLPAHPAQPAAPAGLHREWYCRVGAGREHRLTGTAPIAKDRKPADSNCQGARTYVHFHDRLRQAWGRGGGAAAR